MRRDTLRLVFAISFLTGLTVVLTACGGGSQHSLICEACPVLPGNSFLFAVGGSAQSTELLSFPIDPSTGALGAPLSIVGPTSQIASLTAAAQSTPFLYVVPWQQVTFPNQLYGYSINPTTGALTQIASSPFTAPDSLELNTGVASNNFLYLGGAAQLPGGDTSAVEAFTIGSDGSLAPPVAGSPFPASYPINSLGSNGVSSPATYLYAAEGDDLPVSSGAVAAFSIDQQTGGLTNVAGSPFSTDSYGFPGQIIYDPLGFVYVTISNQPNGPNYIEGFAVNASTGGLTAVPGSPFPVSTVLFGPALDASGHFLFAGVGANDTIDEFQVDPTTGSLTAMSGTTVPVFVPFLIVGNYLYAPSEAGVGSSAIAAFSIDESSGALSQISGSPFATVIPFAPSTTFVMTTVTVPPAQ
jgi:6-phosphogluconolactonase